MSIFRRVANLFSPSKVAREIDAELGSHVEMRIEDNIANGMSPEEARRDALLRFGNRTAIGERVAGEDAALVIENLICDMRRYAQPRHSRYAGSPQIVKPPVFQTADFIKFPLGFAETLKRLGSVHGEYKRLSLFLFHALEDSDRLGR